MIELELSKIKAQLASSDEEVRRGAVLTLTSFPFETVKHLLYQAMGDQSWRIRKETVEIVTGVPYSERFVDDLVSLLESHDNAGLRNSAVEVICRLGTVVVPVLSRRFRTADQDVRKFIIDIIGDIAAVDAFPLLLEALEDADQNVSTAAVENLGKLGDATAITYLLKCLAKPDNMVRFTALEALVKIGKPLPIEDLLPLAQEKFLRKAVFDCFGVAGNPEAVPLLLGGLQENRSIREAAAVALMKIRRLLVADDAARLIDGELSLMKGSPAVTALIESIAAHDQGVRESCITILGLIGDERAAAPLLQASSDGRVARQCIAAFKEIGEAGAKFLVKSFADAEPHERRFIAYACGEMELQNCTEILWQGMRDPDPELRAVSVTAAGKTGQSVLVDRIAALLDDESADVRQAALRSLSCLPEGARETLSQLAQTLELSALPEKRRNAAVLFAVLRDVEKLSMLVKDEDVSVREAAVLALAEGRGAEVLGHLVMALVDEAADVRIAAARALGERGGEDVLDPLLLALRDDDPWVACEALRSLGKVGSSRAIAAVSEMVRSLDPPVVIAALESLPLIQGDDAMPTIESALDHPDEEVVKAAIEILSAMGNSWVEGCREKLIAHPHWDVRRTFVRTMAMLCGESSLPHLKVALSVETDALVKRQLAELVERMQ